MENAVTIYDIAERAGVSHVAVSNVLNRDRWKGKVSPHKAEQIRAIAAQLGYVPNHAARSLRSGKTQSLVVATLGSLKYAYVNELIEALHAELVPHGYHVNLELLHHVPHHERVLMGFHKGRCDGVIFLGGMPGLEALLTSLQQGGLPLIIAQGNLAPGIDGVDLDEAEAARLAVEHLAQQGHRSIAAVMHETEVSPPSPRMCGYRKGLAEAGLKFEETLAFRWVVDWDAAQLWKKLSAAVPRPTAVYTFNEEVAMKLLRVLRLQGLRVPADLAIVTLGNTRLVQFAELPLTVVGFDVASMARAVVKRLVARIDNPSLAVEHLLLKPNLVIGESSVRPATVSAFP